MTQRTDRQMSTEPRHSVHSCDGLSAMVHFFISYFVGVFFFGITVHGPRNGQNQCIFETLPITFNERHGMPHVLRIQRFVRNKSHAVKQYVLN